MCAIESRGTIMQRISVIAIATFVLLCANSAFAIDQDYVASITQWRGKVDASLRRDNGWLRPGME